MLDALFTTPMGENAPLLRLGCSQLVSCCPYCLSSSTSTSKYQLSTTYPLSHFLSLQLHEPFGVLFRRSFSEDDPGEFEIDKLYKQHTNELPQSLALVISRSLFLLRSRLLWSSSQSLAATSSQTRLESVSPSLGLSMYSKTIQIFV
jgi:hypothetical protein